MILLKALKKIIGYVHQKTDPIGYARKLGVTVGDRCILESFNFGTEPYLITIGNHVEITTNVTFITHDGATWVIRDNSRYKDVIRFGKIVIKDNVFIGHGTIILPNVEIGENVVIGAGSVVADAIPSNSVYAGIPAKYICTIEEYAEKCLKETPDWNKEEFKKDKKGEIIKVVSIGRKKDEENHISFR